MAAGRPLLENGVCTIADPVFEEGAARRHETGRPESRSRSPSGPAYSVTMMAVTRPKKPAGLSAWERMWQWNAQTPGSVHSTIVS